ncbi:MAG TPA: LysM peptidoglycan-binding domain-containing protein [Steroidobacteraceae bacterium]|jgi:LysM repeat protein|nr:LysM peptidoglycan-binding domain-containing protein [Steroidobacteraceae bacterium]
MVSNLAFRARLAAGLALSVTLAGCSLLHGSRQTAPAATAESAPPPAAQAAPAGEHAQTATEAAVASADAPQPQASAAPAPQINPNAPLTYTVKRGDTLWGIASMYLRDPWNWPEVWYINPHIRNPHLIYPGDKLALAYDANGRPQVRLVEASALRLEPRLRSTPITSAIPTIPYSAISAFLERPTVLTQDEVRDAAHIIAFKNDHVIAGSGHVVYIRGLGETEHARFSIVHVGDSVRDPDNGHVLGYVGIYTATALVSQPVTNPVRAVLIDTARETLVGDKVMSSDVQAPHNLMPHAPATQVDGKIAWIVGDTGISDLAGQFDIVVINRGSDAGLEPGNVLEVDQAGEVVHDTYGAHGGVLQDLGAMGSSLAPRVKLPDERAGTLLVFKTYPQLSFGLIVGASDTIAVGDIVHNP